MWPASGRCVASGRCESSGKGVATARAGAAFSQVCVYLCVVGGGDQWWLWSGEQV